MENAIVKKKTVTYKTVTYYSLPIDLCSKIINRVLRTLFPLQGKLLSQGFSDYQHTDIGFLKSIGSKQGRSVYNN